MPSGGHKFLSDKEKKQRLIAQTREQVKKEMLVAIRECRDAVEYALWEMEQLAHQQGYGYLLVLRTELKLKLPGLNAVVSGLEGL